MESLRYPFVFILGPLAPDSCIPQKIPHFVGRKQQSSKILHNLTNESTRLVGIWGPPGFGKTSVAINVAHHLREIAEIPVYFISLRGMNRKDDLVSKLLSIFTVTKQVPHPQISASDWLIQCLQQLQNCFVLILNNADDLLESGNAKLRDVVLRFVEEMVTRCNHIKLLFTTRGSLDYLSHKLPMYQERVGVLDEVASGRLVRLLLPDLSDDDCQSIVRECGQVPLAIRLMCTTIGGNVSLDELLEEIKIAPLVEVLDNESLPDDVRLKSIINTCFQRLNADERDAFVSLAVFPGSFGIEEATAILDLKTAFQTKKMLLSLERKALMISNDFISISYTIHSLLLSFIDEKRKEEEEIEAVFKAAEHRFYDYNISNFRVTNDKFLTGHSSEALFGLFAFRERIISSLVNGARVEELYPKVVEVLSKAELVLHFVLSDEESLFEKLYDTAIKEAKKRQNLVDERMLLAAKSFRHWAWFTTDHQTWEHSLQSAGCFSTADFSAKMLCYHGVYQLLYGKVDEGLSSLRSAVDRLGSCCDEEVLRILSYDVLAHTYHGEGEHLIASHFENRFSREAKGSWLSFRSESLKDSLFSDDIKEIARRMEDDGVFNLLRAKLLMRLGHGSDSPLQDTSFNVLNNLFATVFEKSEDVRGGISLLKLFRKMLFLLEANGDVEPETLAYIEKKFSSLEHLDQLLSEDSLSFTTFTECWWHVTEIMAADWGAHWMMLIVKECLKPVIGYWKVILRRDCGPGVDSEEIARGYDKFGVIQRRIEDYNGAIESHQQAIREREDNVGDQIDTVSSLTNIGCVYFEMNNDIEAVKSFQSALELRKKLGVYHHEDTADIYHTLGENYLTVGNYAKAMEAHLQALELRRKHLGEHPKTAESLNGLGVVHYKMGENQYARETFHNAVDVTKKMLGKHGQTANSCHNLALTYLAMRSYPEALEFCQQALSMRLELSGKSCDTVASFYTLGRISFKMGDKESAIEAFQKGATTPHAQALEQSARCYYWLGKVQYGLGDLNGALESSLQAMQMRKKLLGDHPDTAKSERLLNRVIEAVTANKTS